jgi:hypothetical protein
MGMPAARSGEELMGDSKYIQTMADVGEELDNYIDQDGERLSTLGPIGRVNILIGPTNSGKSRFMRGLARSSRFICVSIDPSAPHPNHALNSCKRLFSEKYRITIEIDRTQPGFDESTLTEDYGWLARHVRPARQDKTSRILLNAHDFRHIAGLLERKLVDPTRSTKTSRDWEELSQFAESYRFGLQASKSGDTDVEWITLHRSGLTEEALDSIEGVLRFIESLSDRVSVECTPRKVVYIPVLRTAVALAGADSVGSADLLAQSVGANYALDSRSGNIEVFTGNLLYETVDRDLRGDSPTRKRLRDFENFLSNAFFEGMSVELIPLAPDNDSSTHLALWLDEQTQRRLHDIGDGIQAIILLMYRLFTAEAGSWFFIEEPEQGLHPGLQRIFLETLVGHPNLREKDLTIFMSTHSNHLLGMAMSAQEDVSVFSFQRWVDPERFEVRPVHTQHDDLLTLLGVTNSSVFLANCGIWVEGITDRKYLRAYLAAYLRSNEFEAKHSFAPQEDVHYAFFEYAGSNLVHYMFESDADSPAGRVEEIRARFLCNRIFLLADRDIGREQKHERFAAWQSTSFQYFTTPGIEVENLISETQLQQALPNLISGLTEGEVAKAKLQFVDYREKRLGTYLKGKLGPRCPDALEAASGTLSAYYKDKLATLVCPIVTWENMSEDARMLTKALYRFIHQHNQIAPKLS